MDKILAEKMYYFITMKHEDITDALSEQMTNMSWVLLLDKSDQHENFDVLDVIIGRKNISELLDLSLDRKWINGYKILMSPIYMKLIACIDKISDKLLISICINFNTFEREIEAIASKFKLNKTTYKYIANYLYKYEFTDINLRKYVVDARMGRRNGRV